MARPLVTSVTGGTLGGTPQFKKGILQYLLGAIFPVLPCLNPAHWRREPLGSCYPGCLMEDSGRSSHKPNGITNCWVSVLLDVAVFLAVSLGFVG
jgi:hypothetical protein